MEKCWQDQQRRGAQASSCITAVVPREKFTDPTSGLEKVTLSWGTTRNASRFKDTLDKLAQHVGMLHVYRDANTVKEMKDMAEPVFTQPVRPPRNYYKFWKDQQISDQKPMVETSDRFNNG